MKLVKDVFFIDADPDINKELRITGSDGNYLYVDIDFDPYSYATRVGIVTHVPEIIDDEYLNDNPIVVGDAVMFHHFVCQDENEVIVDGKQYFKAHYGQIYAKIVQDGIEPLERLMYVEPIIDSEADLFNGQYQIKNNKDVKEGHGTVLFLSKQNEKEGLKIGDIVYYTLYAAYKTDVFNTELFRMRQRNIRLIIRDGEMVYLDNMVILKDRNKVHGLGDLVTDIKIGDRVGYFSAVFADVNYNEVDYVSLKRDNINFII